MEQQQVQDQAQVQPVKKKGFTLRGTPWWAWIFTAACIAIPIVALGGALPIAFGLGGAAGVVNVSQGEKFNTPVKVLICLGITVIAWGLFGLLLLAVTALASAV